MCSTTARSCVVSSRRVAQTGTIPRCSKDRTPATPSSSRSTRASSSPACVRGLYRNRAQSNGRAAHRAQRRDQGLRDRCAASPSAQGHLAHNRSRRIRGAHGTFGVGQVDLAQHPRLSRRAERRSLPARSPRDRESFGCRVGADTLPLFRFRVSIVLSGRALHDCRHRRIAHGLSRPRAARAPAARTRPARARRPRRIHRPPADGTDGRHAAASGHRTCAGEFPEDIVRRRTHGHPRHQDRPGDHSTVRRAQCGGHDYRGGDARCARGRTCAARAYSSRRAPRRRPRERRGGMNPFELLRIALDALAANKVRSFLTMLGVIIGVASVIMLVAIGEGAKNYIRKELMGIGTNLLIIDPGKTETSGMGHMPSGVQKLTLTDMHALEKRARLLVAMAPVVVSSAPVKYENRMRNVQIIGTDESFEAVRNLHADIGSFLTKADVDASRRVAVIGRTVKKELFGETNPLGRTIKIGETKFRVIGIMANKGVTLGQDIDDLVFIPVETAQELFDQDGLTNILTQVINESATEGAKQQIKDMLKERHAGEEDFTIVSQQAMLSTMQTILTSFTYVLAGIASISLLVGGIGIMNIMQVSVRERTREIGLRKAIGAARSDILLQFVIESVVLSMVGGLIGIVLGAGVAYGAKAAVPGIPGEVSTWAVLTAVLFAFMVGAFFGIYPASKAARLNPIEALRYKKRRRPSCRLAAD